MIKNSQLSVVLCQLSFVSCPLLSRLALKIVVMALGKRQKSRGKSEEGLGDFTFLYTDWFYCVHLLGCS
ncbi:MAG: hypothetical protein HEP80_06080 [Dolichospermum sp. UKL201]|nr:MAG: hypothetical protein HEP80_06080 [Dolichospermum sp. UKL201]